MPYVPRQHLFIDIFSYFYIMKPVATTLLFLLFLFRSVSSYGQGENNIWCFGAGGGMDFNFGPPVFFNNNINAVEGCASVCDATGNLLFYATPEAVWDRNGNIMPNGSGLNGSVSMTQGAAIVQSYTDPNLYYLFTNDIGSLFYSVIDMTLNGGNGDVVIGQKNIFIESNMMEKMIVVQGDGCYSWLLVHAPSDHIFHAFKIDASGVAAAPVVSNSGFLTQNSIYEFGEMKVSPGNNMIAVASNSVVGCMIELHYFDNTTGALYNPILLDSLGAYGISFSPDGNRLYVPHGSPKYLLQYDLSLLPDVQAVKNSAVSVSQHYYNGMRIGADNKVYMVIVGDVYRINNPNALGLACNVDPNVLHSFGGGQTLGNVFFAHPSPRDTSYDTTICQLDTFIVSAPGGYQSYLWNDGKTTQSDTFFAPGTKWVVSSGACGISTDTFHVADAPMVNTISVTDTIICFVGDTPVLTAPAGYTTYAWSDGKTTQTDTMSVPGIKWVISQTDECNKRTDTFHLHAAPVISTIVVTDTTVCLVNNIPVFSAPGGFTNYLWSDGTVSQTDTMSAAGSKWVQAQSGCNMQVDTFHLHSMPLTITSVVKDTNICLVNNIPILSAPGGYNTYAWSDGKTTQTDTMGSPGTKWVQAQTGCNMLVDTFHVHDWRDTTKMATDTTHCVAYSPITIYAPGGYTSYAWSDGKTTQVDTFFTTVTKWVLAQNGCDLLIDTIHFTANTIPNDSVTMHSGDTTLCFEGVAGVNVTAPSGYTYYLWSDGTPTQTNIFTSPAIKWVYAQNLCTLLIDTFSVSAQPTDTTAGRIDTMICFSSLATLSAAPGYNTYFWSDGTAAQADTFTYNTTKLAYAHKACAERIDTFHLQFINDLSVNLGSDTAVCKGETIKLVATSSYNIAKYLWQDNSTVSVYNVTEGGDYTVKVSVGPCSVSDTVRIHQKVIDVKLKNGLIPCNETEVILDAGVDSSTYLWQDGSSNRTYKATKAGAYSVKVTQGICSTTASANVKFDDCPCIVVLPTAFSPNGDGKNDLFGAKISCDISSYKLMVYNRWGNQLFYSENANDKWDGTSKSGIVDADVFYYYLEFKDDAGKNYYYKGDITIVR